jgi:NADH-quinone oxidoreductase subunit J
MITFLGAAFMLMMLGAIFLGFVLILVYIGAVLVFFLFSVMLIGEKADREHPIRWSQIGLALLMGATLVFSLISLLNRGSSFTLVLPQDAKTLSLMSLGRSLYETHVLTLEGVGILLLMGIFASLSLLITMKSSLKKQKAYIQMHSSQKNVRLVKMPTHKGINDD